MPSALCSSNKCVDSSVRYFAVAPHLPASLQLTRIGFVRFSCTFWTSFQEYICARLAVWQHVLVLLVRIARMGSCCVVVWRQACLLHDKIGSCCPDVCGGQARHCRGTRHARIGCYTRRGVRKPGINCRVARSSLCGARCSSWCVAGGGRMLSVCPSPSPLLIMSPVLAIYIQRCAC